ncbi:MAG: hypothetical protein KTR25_09910 [Myxococcales bacterium]|nr:hypothetical protein [Myxococcales bacterium]
MERLDRLRLSSIACALFIRSVPRKRYFADHPSHFSDGLLVPASTPRTMPPHDPLISLTESHNRGCEAR